jgi:hypothetical protein
MIGAPQQALPLTGCPEYPRTAVPTNIVKSPDLLFGITNQDQRQTCHRHGNAVAGFGDTTRRTGVDPGLCKQPLVLMYDRILLVIRLK